MKKKDYLEKVLEIGSFVMFTALVLNVTFQVLTRNIFTSISAVWTEEASRFLFIYSIVFAAPLAMKNKEYVNVDLILNILPEKGKRALNIFINGISAILFILVSIKGIDFARLGIGQSSATLGISMSIMYAGIGLTSLFIAIYAIYNFIDYIRNMGRGGEVS
ncbi:MAG TPA: TRAP transporter small permease [Tepidimicrobium sp.]|nr:TRAP transporter small permease [Tepidimicrobium sp.]